MQNKAGSKKEFLNYINVFRAVAILFIVAGHSILIDSKNSPALDITKEILCGGTTLFVFIAGFLFQYLSPKFEYKKYLLKKWENVILPYIFTSIPGILLCFYFPLITGNYFWDESKPAQILTFLITGGIHNPPTGFIIMISVYFIFSFLLLKLEKKNVLYKYLPALFILTVLIPKTYPPYFAEAYNWSFIGKFLAVEKTNILNVIHYFSIYIFGMYCSKNRDFIIEKFYNKKIIIAFFMVLTAILDIVLRCKTTYYNGTISKIFLTMLTLGYLKHFDSFILSQKTINKFFDIVAKYSFGIFFIHNYILWIYNEIFNLKWAIPVIDGNYFIALSLGIIRFVTAMILSLIILYLIKIILLKINKNLNTRMFTGV